MSTTAIKLYDILVEKGVNKKLAREAVDEFISREEAIQLLANKADVSNIEKQILALRAELYKALLIHGLVITGAIIGTTKLL